jgi:distribution and morphology protein 10
MTFYLQNHGRKLSSEYIFSTNEALFGFRCLYSFKQGAERLNTALYNNSSLSLGTEVWYGALNMSPGLSTALRYSTQSTYTGKPLTMTLAFNPILGHISSTYSVKTSINSTFSSRYDFNLYSYDSNLSFGCEIFKFKDFASSLKKIDPRLPPYGRSLDDGKESVVEAFESLIQDTDFTSVIKLSTDLNSQNVKVAWEGKYKDFLVSNGVDLQWKATGPDAKKYGFSIQYSS